MSNRRRKTNLLLDPDNITFEETSLDEGPFESIHIPINYLEEIDNDVVECSPRAFSQVLAHTRRTRRRVAIDLNLEYQPMPSENIENPTMPSENIENPTIPTSTSVMPHTENIHEPIGQNNINLEVNINEASENDKESPEINKETTEPNIQAVEPPKESEPPKDPILNCPICMDAFVEEMSTRAKKGVSSILKLKDHSSCVKENWGLIVLFLTLLSDYVI
ncbi:unnamed protein product [Vicia faba]|uniref:Uncharacterized protein n=1 Tax=Vicia faba TaxID=3906 RepID=A0AAV1A858_VICFA|nr:unnamed protein product [Vicia faba]